MLRFDRKLTIRSASPRLNLNALSHNRSPSAKLLFPDRSRMKASRHAPVGGARKQQTCVKV